MKKIMGVLLLVVWGLWVSGASADGGYVFAVSEGYAYSEGTPDWAVDISVPEISGMADEDAQRELNAYFLSKGEETLAEYRESAAHAEESMKAGNSPNFMYQYRYETVTDSDDYFVLRTVSFFRSSSVTEASEYWTLDKRTGKPAELEDLADLSEMRKEIFTEMLRFNHDIGAQVYRTDDSSLPDALRRAGELHHWYVNGDGDLVITFDKYELGPAILGAPEFVIGVPR